LRSSVLNKPIRQQLAATAVGTVAVLPDVELSLIISVSRGGSGLNKLLHGIDDSLTGIAWEAIIADSHSQASRIHYPLALPAGCNRLMRRADRTNTVSLPIDKLMSSTSTCIAVMEAERCAEPQLLPGMLNLLRADDADLVVAHRRTAGDSIRALADDPEFSARLAKTLLRLTHSEDLHSVSGQFLMRRQLLNHVRSLSGLRFSVLLDLLRGGKPPWRIIELPLHT
jgi:hypothetical protein